MTKKEIKKIHKKKADPSSSGPGLEKPVENVQDKAQEYLDGWKRIKAEFDNYRKDEQKRMEDFGFFIKAEGALRILPIVDSFDEALKHVPEKDKESEWLKGILKIRSQVIDFLSEQGVKEMEALGKEFDPYFHEAVGEAMGKPEDKDKVIQVLQKGYMMGERVIRPARVYIGK